MSLDMVSSQTSHRLMLQKAQSKFETRVENSTTWSLKLRSEKANLILCARLGETQCVLRQQGGEESDAHWQKGL